MKVRNEQRGRGKRRSFIKIYLKNSRDSRFRRKYYKAIECKKEEEENEENREMKQFVIKKSFLLIFIILIPILIFFFFYNKEKQLYLC